MRALRFDTEQAYCSFLLAYQTRQRRPQAGQGGPNEAGGVANPVDGAIRSTIRRCPTEEEEQKAVIAWARVHVGTWPDLALLCHYPSGGSRHLLEAVKLKKMGVRAGVPDLFLPSARGGYHSLWIELKARDGRLTPTQKKWSAALSKHGCLVHVCFGLQAAIDVLTAYLQMPATLIQKVTP